MLLRAEVVDHDRRSMGPARLAADAVLQDAAAVARLSRPGSDRGPYQPGDWRYRLDSELYHVGIVGRADQQFDPGRHGGRHVLHQLALHADRALSSAGAGRDRLPVYAPDQEGFS